MLTATATRIIFYKVDYTPIPGYIIDEKDLIGYNAKGEKVVLKNQTAYYKAVTCNRTENDDFFNVLGTCSDMNGDVGRQWLALYAVKNELMEPVLASSLVAKVFAKSGDVKIPDGYETGIHMFGSDDPFNLNSSLCDWANDAPGVYIYFKTESAPQAHQARIIQQACWQLPAAQAPLLHRF